MPLHNVFISYHHKNDQWAKDHLVQMNKNFGIYSERSVRDGDISDDLPTQTIRTLIRDKWLRASTVTILLVGKETRYRKHVDWELKTSMIDGSINKKSGILIIMLPDTGCNSYRISYENEKNTIYPDCTNWITLETKNAYQDRYPMLPERIYDNLITDDVRMSITTWNRISDSPESLRLLISNTAISRQTNQYDTSRQMRMANFNP